MHTGVLGPVNVDLNMLEVAALLGPPKAWITDAYSSPVPIYWMYNYLEIEFQPDPPYAINWFQIEHPDALDRPRHRLADLLVLSMDRIDVAAAPSRMLKHLRELPEIVIGVRQDAHDPVLEIYAGTVCLIYGIMDADLKASPDMESEPQAWLRHFDRHCFIDSIYSFREPALQYQYPKDKFRNMSAQEYLAITKGGRRS